MECSPNSQIVIQVKRNANKSTPSGCFTFKPDGAALIWAWEGPLSPLIESFGCCRASYVPATCHASPGMWLFYKLWFGCRTDVAGEKDRHFGSCFGGSFLTTKYGRLQMALLLKFNLFKTLRIWYLLHHSCENLEEVAFETGHAMTVLTMDRKAKLNTE